MREEVRSNTNTHPFHAVAGSDLAELLNVIELRDVRRVTELGVVGRASKVKLPGSFCERVQARGRAGGHHGSRRRGGCRGGRRGARGLALREVHGGARRLARERHVRDDLGGEEHGRARRLGQVALVHEDRVGVVVFDVALSGDGEPLRVRKGRDAEVADLDRAPVRRPQEIRRLDVAVYDALIVDFTGAGNGCMHEPGGKWAARK